MATSFSIVSGVDVANGDTADSTLLNNLVNLATFSSVTSSIMVGFDATANPVDIPYSFATSGLILNRGTNYHTTSYGLTLGDTAANTEFFIGQSSAFGLVMQWSFNATSSSAYGLFGTYSQTNPLKFQANSFSFDSIGQPNAIQISGSGRMVVSAAQADDGLNQLQVYGGILFDHTTAIVSSIAYTGSISVNFTTGNTISKVGISGGTSGLTITTGSLVSGANRTLIVSNTSGATQPYVLPSWIFLGAGAPTSILTGKTGVFSMLSMGTADSSLIAAYAAQP